MIDSVDAVKEYLRSIDALYVMPLSLITLEKVLSFIIISQQPLAIDLLTTLTILIILRFPLL